MGANDRMGMRHRYDNLGKIAGPKEGMGHQNHDAYRKAHESQMTRLMLNFPALEFRKPWESKDRPEPFISGGKWVVPCPCGDYPMASVEWDEARCFACGAIYRKLKWPARQREIESALLARGRAVTRHWKPGTAPETLHAQNVTER